MVETMDITLLEQKKEESMKTFYEINNVVRMSFIEMQYMKKVRVNPHVEIGELTDLLLLASTVLIGNFKCVACNG